MNYQAVVISAIAVSVAVIALIWAVGGERKKAPRAALPTDARSLELRIGVGRRAIGPTLRWFSVRARRLTPIGMIEGMDRRIKLAGWSDGMPLERALALKFLIALGAAAAGLYFMFGRDSTMIGIALIVVGYFAMDLILWGRARDRQLEIEKALPDTMDQLKISVESGLGFDAALERISRHSGALADEFGRVASEIQLGVTRREAMRNLVDRTDVSELRRFVAALVHAEGFGVPLAQVLRAQAEDLRDKRRQKAQEKAQRIPVLIIFPLLAFIFPSIFVILLGPAAINIFNTLLGDSSSF